ncbi:oxidoreductase [Lactobacillus taiwanensis]|uniref:SDR family oxidoreductase n=1 Tax=Lactobacillus taiwanensis TaxID=508451 RepID=UPI000B99177B|nr:SDR family oxidoreductase [Lactobacillus taiwanensis]OYS21418.1 oxidoreductase [Lactobacillus taiwanensis]OYS24349.1 oxidoreductase [Lactobacillus taiwanensis]OYS25468.1 oxidoreductase [Lactobacillus taiwanensis]OYS25808.1 oxidoreductase [Lactobacillus taiwanensis]OYS27859.1 oxidoreductase [Lactobacillus taiwanensis]
MSLKDKVIIITGASSGIGAETTKYLAGKGAKLIIAARRKDRLDELKDSLPKACIRTIKADVTNFEEVQAVVDYAIDKYGRIDVMYNNAGVMPVNPLIKGQRQEWQRILDINIMGVLNGIAADLPVMVKQKSGYIIATDSVAGHVVVPNLAVYNGSKFAVRAIMEDLRQEQRENGIKTSIVSPGAVHTELFNSINDPANRQAEIENEKSIGLDPKQIARAVAFAIDTPEDTDVNEIIIRPMGQAV